MALGQKGGLLRTNVGDVLDTPLTGFVVGANTPITAADNILTALEKTQGQINAITASGTYIPFTLTAATNTWELDGKQLTITNQGNTKWNVTDGILYDGVNNESIDHTNRLLKADNEAVMINYATSANGLRLGNIGSTSFVALKNTNVTALRTLEFPNISGTFALTSDIPSLTGYLKANGSIPLTANWNVGGFSLLNINDLALGVATATAVIDVSQNMSSTTWTTNGIGLRWRASTYTDTTSTGTVADMNIHIFAASTIAATSATTFTNIYGFTATTPIAGTNVTFTNPYAFRSNGVARFDSSITALGNINFFGGTKTIQTSDSNILQLGTNGTVRVILPASGGWFGFGTGTPAAVIHSTYSALTASAWTTSGIGLRFNAIAFTDSTSSGTVANNYIHVFDVPTVAALSATTYTNTATAYFAVPAASTNVTMTNVYSVITQGNILVGGGITLNNAGATTGFIVPNATNFRIATGASNTARLIISNTGLQTNAQDALSSGTTAFMTFTQAAHTGGAQPGLLWTAGTLIGQTASTEIVDQDWNNSATMTLAAGAVTLMRTERHRGRTYAFVSASTITTAITADFEAPIAGTNATITLNYAARFQGDVNMIGGNRILRASNGFSVDVGAASPFSINQNTANKFQLTTTSNYSFLGSPQSSGTTAYVTFTQSAYTGGSFPGLLWTSGAHTGQTASTEVSDINFDMSATRTWATGAITLQRDFRIQGRTYAFIGASVITTAVTLNITAPIAGTNATITNNFAIRSSGNICLATAGDGFYIKEGSNATMGVATMTAGTVTVATTKVTANSRIFLEVQSLGTVAVATPVSVTARVNGTSFTISSSSVTDTSVVAWCIMEPAP